MTTSKRKACSELNSNMSKRVRIDLLIDQKREICDYAQQNPSMTKQDIANHFTNKYKLQLVDLIETKVITLKQACIHIDDLEFYLEHSNYSNESDLALINGLRLRFEKIKEESRFQANIDNFFTKI